MRSIRLAAPVFVAILASVSLADTSGGSSIDFGYDEAATSDAQRFTAPTVVGVLVPGQPVSVTIDLRRFIFPASCADSARVQSATLIVRDPSLGDTVQAMTLASSSARVTITVPRGPTLDLGFVATTEGGCVARETHFEAFYHFAVDTQAAVLQFGAAARQPSVSGAVTPGHALVIAYDPARLNATYGTDAEGNAIALSSCGATYMGQDTMSLSANVTFLDANGNPLAQEPNPQLLYQSGAARSASFDVPTAARSFTIYVSAANYYDPRCGYDSDGGNNFKFTVGPSSTPGIVSGLHSP